MQDDPPGEAPPSWLERLSYSLLREPRDRQQLITLLRDAQQRELLDAEVLSMIEGALQVSDMQVRDIMVPRPQAVFLERDAPLDEILDVVIESAHSRFPVIGENRDEVVGILLAKDILRYLGPHADGSFPIGELMRPAVFVPESKRLNVLLREFRTSRNHMAIVVDEYGGMAGLVTIEDVLEEIVGEIDDEHDVDEEHGYIKRNSASDYTVKAVTPIEDFNEAFTTDFRDDDFDTVGGLVLKALGRLPGIGETVDVEGLRFEVLQADARRIHTLKVDPSQRHAAVDAAPGGE